MPGPIHHILVVNDDAVVAMVTARILEQHGYRVTTAKDGDAGLKALATETPDLMVLDVQMPDLDGVEMIARMKEFVLGTLVRINAIMDGEVDDRAPEDFEEDETEAMDSPSVDGYLNAIMPLGEAVARIKAGKLKADDVVVVDVSTLRFMHELVTAER